MIPTLQQVYDGAREILSDVVTAGGSRWTNPRLKPFLQTAYSQLFAQIALRDLPVAEFRSYPILAPYQSIVYPSTIGIASMGEPVAIYERGFLPGNSIALTAVAVPAGGRARCTATAHPFLTGQLVTLHGVTDTLTDDIEDEWPIEPVSATQFDLIGPVAQGTAATGGTATYSTEEWRQIQGPIPPAKGISSTISTWDWLRDRFQFNQCSATRQLKIVYQPSGQLPSNDTRLLALDDCLEFLKYATAGFALKETAPTVAARFLEISHGNAQGNTESVGGHLYQLLAPQVRSAQLPRSIRRPPFRPRRHWTNRYGWGWWAGT